VISNAHKEDAAIISFMSTFFRRRVDGQV